MKSKAAQKRRHELTKARPQGAQKTSAMLGSTQIPDSYTLQPLAGPADALVLTPWLLSKSCECCYAVLRGRSRRGSDDERAGAGLRLH